MISTLADWTLTLKDSQGGWSGFWTWFIPTVAVILTAVNLYFSNRNFGKTLQHQQDQLNHQREKDKRAALEEVKEIRRQVMAELVASAFMVLNASSRVTIDVSLFSIYSKEQISEIAGAEGVGKLVYKFMEKVAAEMPATLIAYYTAKAKFHAVVPASDRVPELAALEKALQDEMLDLESTGKPKAPKHSAHPARLKEAIDQFAEAQSEQIRKML